MGNILTRALDFLTGEKRSASVSSEAWSPELARIFGLGYNGTTVNERTSKHLAPAYRCIALLSESVAKLPLHVFETTNGRRQVAKNHPVHRLLYSEPNEHMTSFAFRQAIMEITLQHGNGYARIIRGPGQRPVSLKLYQGGTCSILESQGQLLVQTPDGLIPYYDIFHLRGLGTGIEGLSPIRYAAESMGISLAAQNFGRKFFENGAHLSGVLEYPNKLDDTAYYNLKKRWKEANSGTNNAGETAILEHGLKYTPIGIPPDDAQFIETRKFGTREICQWYGVQPHKVFDLENATFSNIEHQNIEWVVDGLMPWLVRFEQEAYRKLFRENEKPTHYAKFNTNALMRGDSQARAVFYKEMFQIGVFTQNMILELEDLNPFDDGDRRYVQGNNMVPIDRIDDVLTAKMAQKTTKTNENEGE
jgi:HK97 family phage portal protein